jgi:K+-sensing histidine kinase KdpD
MDAEHPRLHSHAERGNDRIGTDLGLSIAQRFVKDHQGQLKLENDAEGNASVTLNLAVI